MKRFAIEGQRWRNLRKTRTIIIKNAAGLANSAAACVNENLGSVLHENQDSNCPKNNHALVANLVSRLRL